MNHHDCVTALIGRQRADAERRRAAQEHAARCSDCWAVLALLHELALGAPQEDASRMAALFGCGPVQDNLYQLAGLDAAALRAAHPEAARHLGWCHACRERFAEVATVELAAARGELDEPLFAPEPRWRDVGARAGERLRELVGRLAIEVRRTAAAFVVVPEGVSITGALAPAGAMRGDAEAGEPGGSDAPDKPGLGRSIRLPLADTGIWVELLLEPEADERVGLRVTVSGPEVPRLSLQLRDASEPRGALLVRRTVESSDPSVVHGLSPGSYALELHDAGRGIHFRLRFEVTAAG